MEFVDWGILGSIAIDMIEISPVYPAADNIWRYMNCILDYNINTIVIGQNPYPSELVPFFGAAFSQADGTKDTPTTRIFSLHFTDQPTATKFIRSTWSLLPSGRAFVNADYFPTSEGGGSSDIECMLRIARMVEFLFYAIVSRTNICRRLTLMCSGNLAGYCGSLLSRRLRSLGVSVEQLNFKQPAFLSRIKFNEHLIGNDERYVFCQGRALECFKSMMSEYCNIDEPKAMDMVRLCILNMSDDKVSPMTKKALESIAGQCKAVVQRLDVNTKEVTNIADANVAIKDLEDTVRDLSKTVTDLANLLLGDAYTYKAIVAAESSQVPVASREQHASAEVEHGSEAPSIDSSFLSHPISSNQRPKTKTNAARNMFKAKRSPRLTTSATKFPPSSEERAAKPSVLVPSSGGTARTLFNTRVSKRQHNTPLTRNAMAHGSQNSPTLEAFAALPSPDVEIYECSEDLKLLDDFEKCSS
jgi:hypothetical protein